VPGEHEVRAALRDLRRVVGRVTEHDARASPRRAGERGVEVVVARDRIVDADDRQRRAADVRDRGLVAQHLVAVALEDRAHARAPHEVVVVAEDREHARRAQPAELLGGEPDLVPLPAHVVAGHHDQIRLRGVRGVDRGAHVRARGQVPDVDVGELRDPDAVVPRVEPVDRHLVLGDPRRDGSRHAKHCESTEAPWQCHPGYAPCVVAFASWQLPGSIR